MAFMLDARLISRTAAAELVYEVTVNGDTDQTGRRRKPTARPHPDCPAQPLPGVRGRAGHCKGGVAIPKVWRIPGKFGIRSQTVITT